MTAPGSGMSIDPASLDSPKNPCAVSLKAGVASTAAHQRLACAPAAPHALSGAGEARSSSQMAASASEAPGPAAKVRMRRCVFSEESRLGTCAGVRPAQSSIQESTSLAESASPGEP